MNSTKFYWQKDFFWCYRGFCLPPSIWGIVFGAKKNFNLFRNISNVEAWTKCIIIIEEIWVNIFGDNNL